MLGEHGATSSSYQYFLLDGLNSVAAITNSTGALLEGSCDCNPSLRCDRGRGGFRRRGVGDSVRFGDRADNLVWDNPRGCLRSGTKTMET